MSRCPTKSLYLQDRLCEFWYPYGCGTKCRNMFKNWLKQSDEVSKYHYEAEKEVYRCKLKEKYTAFLNNQEHSKTSL